MNLTLSAAEICKLMRKHNCTIRQLAERTQISQKRIRQVRSRGISGLAVLDWQQAITGEFTARMRAQLNQWRNQKAG